MRFTLACVCLLFHNIDAAGHGRKLRGRGPDYPAMWPASDKVEWGPQPGPVDEKPAVVKKAASLHHEWFVPLASLKNIVLANWIQLTLSASVWMALVIIIAIMYKNASRYYPEIGPKPLDPSSTQSELSEWQSEWYQCHRYPETFLWACCCPCVRWAHTMDLLQLVDYWPAFVIFFILEVLNQMTAFAFVGICLTLVLVFYRQKFRKMFGMDNYGTCAGYAADCLGLLCCWPCLIAQEAHHVSQAAKMGWTKELAVKSGPFSARFVTSVSQES